MNQEELDKILKDHALWLLGSGGKRAILDGANLTGVNLRGASLERAILQRANLSGAPLKEANLKEAILQGVNLSGANLERANLQGANLIGAFLQGTNFSGVNLRRAVLQRANLQGANLEGSRLPNFQIVPQFGRFIAWKKLCGDRIAKLEIPASAQRTSTLVGRKCRASKAKVLRIESFDGERSFLFGSSFRKGSFKYEVGKYVFPEGEFSDDIRIECASGIHFFITKEEAIEYIY